MTRFWPLATLIFGSATLAALIAIGQTHEVQAGYPDGGFAEDLSRFQRADDVRELARIFGDPPRAAAIAAMDAGNRVDLFAFVPAYALFLCAAAAMLAGGLKRPIVWLALAPILVGVAGDVVETHTQLRITANWEEAGALLPLLSVAAWSKYFGLAIAGLGFAAIALSRERRNFLIAALGCFPIVITLADRLGLITVPTLMSAAFGLLWLGLFGVAALRLARH